MDRRHAAVEKYLVERLGHLRDDLELESNHFFVGISQLACGADTLFTRACLRAVRQPIPQRIFLPQHRELFLAAVGSKGTPDFTPDENAEAKSLLKYAVRFFPKTKAAEEAKKLLEENP